MRKIVLFIAMSLEGYIADSRGGADLIQQLMHNDLIDQYYISVILTLLGSGIRLFGNLENEIKLKLLKILKMQTYNEITDLVYIRRSRSADRNDQEIAIIL